MAQFTPTQGRYLAFIHAYTELHGIPPAESEIAVALCVSPPSVNQMVKTLEKKGLILRQPGQARSLEILIPAEDVPPWSRGRRDNAATRPRAPGPRSAPAPSGPPAKLCVVQVFLKSGPVSKAFQNKVCSRTIEIRGDQTLGELHEAIFQAYDRSNEHLYEFQFGNGRMIPTVPTSGSRNLFRVRARAEVKESRREETHGRRRSTNWVSRMNASSATGSTSATIGFTRSRSIGSMKPS